MEVNACGGFVHLVHILSTYYAKGIVLVNMEEIDEVSKVPVLND